MPDRPTSNPEQIIQGAPILHVPDVTATATFYRDVLGFRSDPEGTSDDYTVVWRDNAAIHFARGDSQPTGVLAYYESVAAPPHPTITVVEDLDPSPGVGAWWGEVQTHLHRGLGSLGVITNGSVRDLDELAEGFQVLAGNVGPSHAFVHAVEWEIPVTVHGMQVRPGDLVHADRHGAVVIPDDLAASLPEAAVAIGKGESVLIEASKKPDFDFETLRSLITGRRDH